MIVTNQLLLSLLLASMASPALPQANAAPAKDPQPISRTVFLSRADSLFAAADANKDGALSVEEQQRRVARK